MCNTSAARYYYTVMAKGERTGFQELHQYKRAISDSYLLAEDAADEFEEKNPNIEFPITVFLYNKNHLPLGAFTVEKRVEVSYYAERLK